jgi:hypothetical protein
MAVVRSAEGWGCAATAVSRGTTRSFCAAKRPNPSAAETDIQLSGSSMAFSTAASDAPSS